MNIGLLKKKKKIKSRAACLLLAMMMVIISATGCGAKETDKSGDSDSVLTRIEVAYSSEDMDGTWDDSLATKIALKGTTFSIEGTGASAEGKILTISEAGTYVLNGNLTDGQIQISAGEEDTVRLVLNGANLTSMDSAAIYSVQSGKTILTLAEGTKNSVTDGSKYTYEEGADEPDSAIFSKSDLTVNGSGSLKVTGNYNDGITSKDDLVITGGNISITAINDGLKGRDSIAINNGTFKINVNGDGLQASNDEDADKGWISLDGGTFSITSGNDGIQAETQLQVATAEISVTTGGGSANASTNSDGSESAGWGKWTDQNTETAADETAVEEETPSAKGLKAGTGIILTSGSFNLDTSDDAVHCNGDVRIDSGKINASSGDDGIHADASLEVNDGTIEIAKSYEGLEASSITINDGTVRLNANDDGFNAAGGNDGSSTDSRQGANSFAADASIFIHINGGHISVDADGDGIDSNGSITITGGTILVNGPTNNGNGAMDYNGECLLTGGVLAIAGSSGMAQSPGDTSTQNSITVYYSSVQAAGTLVTLADGEGSTILSFAPSKEYQSIVISSPDLETGETYTLLSGGTNSGKSEDGLYGEGTFTGGTELTKIKISEIITKISDDGTAVTGGQEGMGGQPPTGQAGDARPEEPSGAAPGGEMPNAADAT